MSAAPQRTETSSALAFLADEDLFPLEVGIVEVDLPAGKLRRLNQRAPVPFGFSFAGHAFEAQAVQSNDIVVVDCAAVICRLPYSIEDRARRLELTRVIAGLNGTGLRSEISRDQVVRVGIRLRITPPATADRIVAAVIEHLLPVKGWLELLVEVARRPKPRPVAMAPVPAAQPAPVKPAQPEILPAKKAPRKRTTKARGAA